MTPSRLSPWLQRLFSHVFELGVAVVWFIVGIAYMVDPLAAVHSPIAHNIGHWVWAWIALYLAGSPLIVIGLLGRKVNLRIGGLILVMSGLMIQFIAAVYSPWDLRSLTYLVYATACCLRLYMLRGVYFHGKAYQL